MNCSAKDVKLAVLFDKKCARKYDVKPDFSAFDVDDKLNSKKYVLNNRNVYFYKYDKHRYILTKIK